MSAKPPTDRTPLDEFREGLEDKQPLMQNARPRYSFGWFDKWMLAIPIVLLLLILGIVWVSCNPLAGPAATPTPQAISLNSSAGNLPVRLGEAVQITGSAPPGSRIQLLNQGAVVAEADADANGNFQLNWTPDRSGAYQLEVVATVNGQRVASAGLALTVQGEIVATASAGATGATEGIPTSAAGQATAVAGGVASATGQATAVAGGVASATGQATTVAGGAASATEQATAVAGGAASATGQAASATGQATTAAGSGEPTVTPIIVPPSGVQPTAENVNPAETASAQGTPGTVTPSEGGANAEGTPSASGTGAEAQATPAPPTASKAEGALPIPTGVINAMGTPVPPTATGSEAASETPTGVINAMGTPAAPTATAGETASETPTGVINAMGTPAAPTTATENATPSATVTAATSESASGTGAPQGTPTTEPSSAGGAQPPATALAQPAAKPTATANLGPNNTLTVGAELTGTAPPNLRMGIFLDNLIVGWTESDANGAWKVVVPSYVSPGTYTLRLLAVDDKGLPVVAERAGTQVTVIGGGKMPRGSPPPSPLDGVCVSWGPLGWCCW